MLFIFHLPTSHYFSVIQLISAWTYQNWTWIKLMWIIILEFLWKYLLCFSIISSLKLYKTSCHSSDIFFSILIQFEGNRHCHFGLLMWWLLQLFRFFAPHIVALCFIFPITVSKIWMIVCTWNKHLVAVYSKNKNIDFIYKNSKRKLTLHSNYCSTCLKQLQNIISYFQIRINVITYIII